MKTYCDCHNDYPRDVRVLPSGEDSNLIVCRQGYLKEIAFRKDRNTDLSKDSQFDLPSWESLKIYV